MVAATRPEDAEDAPELAAAPAPPPPPGQSMATRSAIFLASPSALRRTLMRRFGRSNEDLAM